MSSSLTLSALRALVVGLCVVLLFCTLQDAADGAQLVLQHVTAKGDSLAFSTSAAASASALYGASNSGSGSVDCTSFDFPVLLDGSSKHGNISARLLLPRLGLNLQLQEPIMVHVPLLLAAVNSSLTVKADSRPFAVGVRLNHPAPAGGVAVQLQLDDPAAAKVGDSALESFIPQQPHQQHV